jgi:hypothetical protein
MKAMSRLMSTVAGSERECKYWLDRESFDLEEAYAYNLSPHDRREIKKIIFEHFEYIEQQWNEFQWRRLR